MAPCLNPLDRQTDVNKARGDTPGQEDMTPPPKTISSNSSKLAAPKADAAARVAAATRVQAVTTAVATEKERVAAMAEDEAVAKGEDAGKVVVRATEVAATRAAARAVEVATATQVETEAEKGEGQQGPRATGLDLVQRGYSAQEKTAASIRSKGNGAASEPYALPASVGLDDEELSQLRRYPLDGQTGVNMALDATPCLSGEDMAHDLNSASKPKPTPPPSQSEGKEIDSRATRTSQTRQQRSLIRKPSPKQSDGIHCTGSKDTATRNKSK
jgi:hypothetical protein